MGPRLERVEGGWAAIGDGWAVFGPSKEEASANFRKAEVQHEEISQRPDEQRSVEGDGLEANKVPNSRTDVRVFQAGRGATT